MIVRKKFVKPLPPEKAKMPLIDEDAINEIIYRGGKTAEENVRKAKKEKVVKILLGIPKRLLDQIDKEWKKRIDILNRTQWIIETLAQKLDIK